MTGRRPLLIGGLVAAAALLSWLLFVVLPRHYRAPTARPAAAVAPAAAAAQPTASGRKIKARLLYVAANGLKLVSAEQDVPYGEGTAQQAREIVNAQLVPAAAPAVSAVPPGTKLRALFVTGSGEAYVDLSAEFATAHTGGTTDEALTIYTIVDALTINLPAITSVQLLVDGKEVETLAGHVDLRRPLTKNADLVE